MTATASAAEAGADPHHRVRHDRVVKAGKVTLRQNSQLHSTLLPERVPQRSSP